MVLKLDQLIREDLEDLLFNHELSKAIALNNSHVLRDKVSTKGLPGYFSGKRDAKTVLVMLNPRQNAEESDWGYRCQVYKLFIDDQHGLNVFFNTYLDAMTNYGRIDKHRHEPFDLKQAYFLQDWVDSGVKFPKEFTNNSGTKLDRDIALTAKENVLTQKLQLELVPYYSSTFGIKDKKMLNYLMPYLETIFNEIFAHNRKYVIFCSGIFECLFKYYQKYNKAYYRISYGTFNNSIALHKFNGRCSNVYINHRNDENRIKKVLIANTFSSRRMLKNPLLLKVYGKACFDHFNTKP